MKKNHRIFTPIIASSLALALGVNVALAQCQVSGGKPNSGCTPAGNGNSGMWYGDFGHEEILTQVLLLPNLSNFEWDTTTTGFLTPKNYNTLYFEFSPKANNITGSADPMDKFYNIQIPLNNSGVNDVFLLNAGTNILRSNLNIVFNTGRYENSKHYYLNAGGLVGNLIIKNQGNFEAHLTGSITGRIDNDNSRAEFFFTSPSKEKITLSDIKAGRNESFDLGASNRLTFSNVEAEINGSITGKKSGWNDIILDSTKGPTKLTINGENIFDDAAFIHSSIGLEARGKNNTIVLNRDLRIGTLSEAYGKTKEDIKLTFINTITRDQSGYTANHLKIISSDFSDDNLFREPKLNGTYQMKIQGDETIKPEEITYQEGSKNNIKVATIAKHGKAGLGSPTGDEQADLRSQGVIDLGAKTVKTLTRRLTFRDFAYFVVETDEDGAIDTLWEKNYITYFLDKSKQDGTPPDPNPDPNPNPNPNQELELKQNVLSSIAISTTGLYLANFNSLNKRLGELRDNNRSNGIWARIFNGQQSNSIGLKSSTNFTTVQTGYDYAFGLNEANNYLGFAISYSHSQSKFKDRATAIIGSTKSFISIDSLRSDLVEVALYNAYVADSGWYNDTVAKFSYLLNKMEFGGGEGNEKYFSNQGDINTYAFVLSNEIGYRIKLGSSDEWYIDPQAEVGFGYFEGQDLKFKERMTNSPVETIGTMDSLLTLRGRVGTSFGYDFKNFASKESGVNAQLYLGVFGEFDYFNGGDVKFLDETGRSETAKRTTNIDMRAVLNVGTNLEIKESTRIYFDFETSFAGKITTDYKVNAGVRYSFGENTNYKSNNAVQKDNEVKEAPIKLQEVEEGEEEE